MPILNLCGGGAGLKLKVKAYATAAIRDAATPAENTIGIVSSTAVNGYCFRSTAPTAGLKDGLVWIRTGSESATPIPADSKGSVILYPVTAEQYQSGVWVTVDAKGYQDGAWSYWHKRLYTDGTQDVEWSCNSASYVTFGDYYISLYVSSGKSARGHVWTTGMIDLTGYSTLKLQYQGGETYKQMRFGYSTDTDLGSYEDYVELNTTSVTVGSIDISAVTGMRYIKANNSTTLSSGAKQAHIHRVWLEA